MIWEYVLGMRVVKFGELHIHRAGMSSYVVVPASIHRIVVTYIPVPVWPYGIALLCPDGVPTISERG
jgi:hypothetical protein